MKEGKVKVSFRMPYCNIIARLRSIDLDFLSKGNLVLDSRKEIPVPASSNNIGFRVYEILVDLKPEWDNFLEKAVDNLKFIFHIDIEKGILYRLINILCIFY